MNKPRKPLKKIVQPGSVYFYFYHAFNKVSLAYFNDWINENLPKGAFDITLSLDEDFDYESGEYISSSIEVGYKILINNTRYVSEMKKYNKRLIKWKKEQCQ